jgi:hypothetical protein
MNIAVVTYAGCVRCIKECRMLAAAGHNLWLFSHFQPDSPPEVQLEDIFMQMSFYNTQQELFELLTGLEFIELVHVHNEPSWMVHVARAAGHKKIVLDAHDLNIVRYGWDKAFEMGGEDVNAIGECDGLIVPCDRYIEIIEEQGKLRIPTLTLYSYVNEEDFVEGDNDLGGIAYGGSIYRPERNHPLPYRIYENVARYFANKSIPFHIYPGRGYEKHMPFYESIGSKVHNTLDQKSWIKELSRHDWGFCGSPVKHRQWDNTLSNKLFDYIAAGIPAFIYQAKATEDMFGLRGIGVVVEDLKDIDDYYRDKDLRENCRKTILEQRKKEWTMESQLEKLEDFYEKVIKTDLEPFEQQETQ